MTPLLSSIIRRKPRRQGTLWLVGANSVLNVLTFIRGIVLVPLYLRFVGGELYGAWLAIGGIVAFLGLCDGGLSSVLTQKVGEAYGAGDSRRLAHYVGSGLLTMVFLSPLPVLAGLALAPRLPQLFGLQGQEFHVLKPAFVLACGSVSLMIIATSVGGMVCAFQRQALHGLIWIIAYSSGIVITLTLLFYGYGLLSLAWGVVSQSALLLVMEGAVFWKLRKQLLAAFSLEISWQTTVELLKPSALMFVARSGNILAGQSDNLLIGIVMGSPAVVVYDLTKRAYELLRLILGTPIGAFAPALAHFFGELQGETAQGRDLTAALLHLSTLVGLVFIGGYLILNRAFMRLWVGSVFYAGELVVSLISIHGLIAAQSLALYHILLSRGHFSVAAWATGGEGVIHLLLVFIFGRQWGLPGVSLAGVVSLAAWSWWLLWHRYCQDFHISWSEALGQMLPLAGVGVGLLAIGLFLRHLPPPTTAAAFLGQGVCYLGAASLWVVLVDRRLRGLAADVLQGRPLIFSPPP